MPNRILPHVIKTQKELINKTKLFTPKSDISYRQFENLKMNNLIVYQSLFNGSIIRDSLISNSDFSRCDFEGTRFEKCTIINVSFQNADVRSAIFSNCNIENCSFSGSFIDDCNFEKCTFTTVDFSSTIFSNSNISNSILNSCSLDNSTNIMNYYQSTIFNHMVLGNCTFHLHIMKGCSFNKTLINVDSLGYIYGLKSNDLKDLNFIFLGNNKVKPSGKNLVEKLHEDFKIRNWNLGLAILRLNFNITSPIIALTEFIYVISNQIENGLVIKKDEFQFLNKIILELKNENRLPIAGLYIIHEFLGKYLDAENKSESFIKMKPIIVNFYNNLYLIIIELIDNFKVFDFKEDDLDREVLLKLKFIRKPDIELVGLLTNINRIIDDKRLGVPKLISTSQGSYIEIIQTTLFTVFALSIFLYGINGALKEFIKLKAGVKIILKKNVPKTYHKCVLNPRHEPPSFVINIMSHIFPNIAKMDLINNVDYNGLSDANIEDIEVEIKDK